MTQHEKSDLYREGYWAGRNAPEVKAVEAELDALRANGSATRGNLETVSISTAYVYEYA